MSKKNKPNAPTGYLSCRNYPKEWRPLPSFILNWTQSAWGASRRITFDHVGHDQQFYDLPSFSKQQKKLAGYSAQSTDHLQIRIFPEIINPAGQKQKLLSLKSVRVLAEILHQYHQRKISFNEKLFFRPSELIKGQGLSLSGTAYQSLKDSLVELAQFSLRIGDRNQSDQLLSFIQVSGETWLNGCCFDSHQDAGSTQTVFWQVRLGQLLGLLHQRSDQFLTFPANLFKEVGRSPSAQWLALHSFRHGFNAQRFYDYKLGTLAKNSHLDAYLAAYQSKRSKLFKKSGGEERQEHWRRFLAKASLSASKRLKRAVSTLKSISLHREVFLTEGQGGEPDQVRMTTARWPSYIEAWLSRLPKKLRSATCQGRAGRFSSVLTLLVHASRNAARLYFVEKRTQPLILEK